MDGLGSAGSYTNTVVFKSCLRIKKCQKRQIENELCLAKNFLEKAVKRRKIDSFDEIFALIWVTFVPHCYQLINIPPKGAYRIPLLKGSRLVFVNVSVCLAAKSDFQWKPAKSGAVYLVGLLLRVWQVSTTKYCLANASREELLATYVISQLSCIGICVSRFHNKPKVVKPYFGNLGVPHTSTMRPSKSSSVSGTTLVRMEEQIWQETGLLNESPKMGLLLRDCAGGWAMLTSSQFEFCVILHAIPWTNRLWNF